jgi:hypothetical protein
MVRRILLTSCVVFSVIGLGIVESAELTISTDDGQGADTYLYYFSGNSNYGTQPSLKVSKNYVPYLKFDLSEAEACPVTSATLTFYGTPDPCELPGYNCTFIVYGLIDGSDEWGETTITYNNAPLVSNPIQQHPYLIELGTVNYTNGDESAITMTNTENALADFLNNRGPDELVTMIIASDKYTSGMFFSTKEDHGDGSEAPYLEITTDEARTVPGNYWLGNTSDNWNISDNWRNERASPDIPDANDLVILASGSNYPVVVDSNSLAKELFIDTGGLNLVEGALSLSTTVLRIKDGIAIDFDGGQLEMIGNAEELIPVFFDDGKIICDPGKEPYAEYVIPSDPNIPSKTIVTLRKEVPRLIWSTEIVDANAPSGNGGNPAHLCVDASGITGNIHAGYNSLNSWYAKELGPSAEPTITIQFDKAYELTEMWVWNYENVFKGYGLKQVMIEYSENGVDFTTLMSGSLTEFTFSLGNYDGTKSDVIDFGNVQAKVVRLTAVGGRGVGNYEYASNLGSYILRELRFYYYNPKARRPDPSDGAEVDIDYDLSWIPGVGAVTGQDVWLGTSELTMEKIGDNIADDAYELDIPILVDNENYVWRVDGLDSGDSTTIGDLWTFTTRGRLSYPDGGIITTAESHAAWGNSATYGASRVVDNSGMTGDTHSMDVAGTYWYARVPDSDPEPWARFTFDNTYYLDEMWIWNCDADDPDDPNRALKRVRIEYSALDDPNTTDPGDWTVLMDSVNPYFVWKNSVDGQHSDIVDFDNVIARHVKITPIGGKNIGNYGSNYGYLLNELRIYHNGVWINPKARVPSPPDGAEVDIFLELGWSPGGGAVTGQDVWFGLTSSTLEKIADNIDPYADSLTLPILENNENYTWRVDGLNSAGSTTQGDEWTFSTRARLRWNPGLIGVIAGTGSPGDGGTTGDRAVNESGINGDLHDSFLWSNGWYCRKPQDVGITEPDLLVEFDRPYQITDMWMWNHDGIGDTEAAIAIKKIKVEYSTDGINYDTIMNGGSETFDNLPHGNLDGTHDTVISFGEVAAKFVRITLLENYGSIWGFKLREVRFYYNVPLWADLDYNKKVNLEDCAVLAGSWLEDNWITEPTAYCLSKPDGDVDGDCNVDINDVFAMAGEWLEDIN